MASIWTKTVSIPQRQALNGDIACEAAVIGAGMAGVLTARLLQESGVGTVVLEANRIATGQTQGTTAKVTAQHGLIYAKLLQNFGEEKALQYARANTQAIAAYEGWVRRAHIDCGWTRCPAYLYAEQDATPLRQEAEAAAQLGLDAQFTMETELPFPICGALRMEEQGRFHPLAFLQAMAQPLTIYEHTRATRVEGDVIETPQGRVRAKHIVFATHFPFINAPGYYFTRMHQERSYVLALEGALQPKGMYLGIEPEGLSLRSADNCLLLGDRGHRTGENWQGGHYQSLRQQAVKWWPASRELAHWSAQDCMPMDHVPYIGRFSADTPHWYVATGFGKWGMSTSMVAAQLLTDLITEVENPDAAVFSPQRFTPAASAKQFLQDGLKSVAGLSRQKLRPGRAEVEALAPGHGGVVDCDGEKLGVYKDADGEVYTVSTRCPHLGCQLEWNPDEKSWDCPCHGSRFDVQGRLLNNPAQEDLRHA